MNSYVLITAAHDEEAFIERTCESVIAQTVRPLKWIVVDDASADDTAGIVERYQAKHRDLIELVRVKRPPGRDFRHKVRAFDIGLERARDLPYSFVGNLDADICLEADYYERILSRFERDCALGLAGGMVASRIDGAFISQNVALDSVAGAVQLFRRQCFEDVGGYLPLQHGGIDAAAEIMARKSGWAVRTFADLHVLEHRRTGTATTDPLGARKREGKRLHSLGYGLPFFLARCLRRSLERPRIIGSLAALYGYANAAIHKDPILLPPDVVHYLRREQSGKLLRLLRLDRRTGRSPSSARRRSALP
jgi:glycosyltransferase involved in cell wall biosynthesis